MQRLLFTTQFKPGGLEKFTKFIKIITTQRVKEYNACLKRYGLRSTKAWSYKINGVDCGYLFHEAENDALERLARFGTSKDLFDRWFAEQLKDCFQKDWELTNLIFEFDTAID